VDLLAAVSPIAAVIPVRKFRLLELNEFLINMRKANVDKQSWMFSICGDNVQNDVYLLGHECSSVTSQGWSVRYSIPLFVILLAFQTDSFPFFSHGI
jgi:hypothetical protein